jgi:hypothetical protein
MYSSTFPLTSAVDGTRPLYLREKELVPILQEAEGPLGQYGSGREISPPSGFHPRTVQPVARSHTYYATLSLLKHTVSPFQGDGIIISYIYQLHFIWYFG